MSLHEKTLRQLIRNRVHDVFDMAQDINLQGDRFVGVHYQPHGVGGFSHNLHVAVSSPGRGLKAQRLNVEMPIPEWDATQLAVCLAETNHVYQQLRELMPEGMTP